MKYYILNPSGENPNNDYKIITVKEADEANFLEDYGSRVIGEGNNLMEALLSFEQWKNNREEGQ